MASFTGKKGSVVIAGTDFSVAGNLCVQSYTVDLDLSIDQFACMGAVNNWASAVAGTKKWSATVEASYDTATGADVTQIQAINSAVVCTFESTDGLAFSGSAWISSTSSTINADGRNTLTLNLIGDGPLTEV